MSMRDIGVAEPRVRLGGLRHFAGRPRLPVSVFLSLFFLVVLLAFCIAPGLFAPQDPTAQDPALGVTSPSAEHLLGTDELGRDILSRLIAGSLSAVGGPVLIGLFTVAFAVVLGSLAGYRGGWIDKGFSRVFDVIFALPALMIAIVVIGVLGGGYVVACAIIVALNLPETYRVIRSAVLEQRVLPYVEATQTLQLTRRRIMFRHILPNLGSVVVAAFAIRFTGGLLALSALSYLGLGVPPGSPNWGLMLAENQVYLLSNPWSALAPAGVLILAAVSMVLVGDWMHDRLSTREGIG